MEPVRQSLQVLSQTRDYSRLKGPWAVNTFADGKRMMKRPGNSLNYDGASPGQGLFNWTAQLVSVQNDILRVGVTIYAL